VFILLTTSSGFIERLDDKMTTLRNEAISTHQCRSERQHEVRNQQTDVDENILELERTAIPQRSPDRLSAVDAQLRSFEFKASQFMVVERVLNSVDYPKRLAREDAIAEAHSTTFRWFSKVDAGSPPEIRLLQQWLKQEDGIFWISGRPGSGKSTFMKLISNHPFTDELLSVWAPEGRLTKASHYFWSSGTEVQRSQEGLLRSLVYEILSSSPDLVRTVCPYRWKFAKQEKEIDKPWTMSELREVISTVRTELADQASTLKLRVCFIIDGLDEFAGDHRQLCESLFELASCPGVKLLVASRAWNIFEESFGSQVSRKLYMHHLTQEDIRAYSQTQLESHPRWCKVQNLGSTASDIIQTITKRAHGVFLWVYLVVKDLKEGLTNHDHLPLLLSRLDDVPDGLEDFFLGMLDSVENKYRDSMARWLKMALAARSPLPMAVYGISDIMVLPASRTKSHRISGEVKPWSTEEWEDLFLSMTRQLNARCKGLLEIRNGDVEFLHRTVRDFLDTAPIQQYLSERLISTFNPSLAICEAEVAVMRRIDFAHILEWVDDRPRGLSNLSSRHSNSEVESLGWSTISLSKVLEQHQENYMSEKMHSRIHEIFKYAEGVSSHRDQPLFAVLDDLHGILSLNKHKLSGDNLLALFWQEIFWHGQAEYAGTLWGRQVTPPGPRSHWISIVMKDSYLITARNFFADHDIAPASTQHIRILRMLAAGSRTIKEGRKIHSSVETWQVGLDPILCDLFQALDLEGPVFKQWLGGGMIALLLELGATSETWIPHMVSLYNGPGARAPFGTSKDRINLPIWAIYTLSLWSAERIEDSVETYMLTLDYMLYSADLGDDSKFESTIDHFRYFIQLRTWEYTEIGSAVGLLAVYILLRQRVYPMSARYLRTQARGLSILFKHASSKSSVFKYAYMSSLKDLIEEVMPERSARELLQFFEPGRDTISEIDPHEEVQGRRSDPNESVGGRQGARKTFFGARREDLQVTQGLPLLNVLEGSTMQHAAELLANMMEEDDENYGSQSDFDESDIKLSGAPDDLELVAT
jgi:hypothetical protein